MKWYVPLLIRKYLFKGKKVGKQVVWASKPTYDFLCLYVSIKGIIEGGMQVVWASKPTYDFRQLLTPRAN